jgi:arylsulfatase A-like enzyme
VATLAIFTGVVLAPAAAAAPNVLVIVTDDQRLDGTMQVMPQTSKWFQTGGDLGGGAGTVSGGTFFPNSVANTPWCCPARSSIFTGLYAHNHGVENLDGTLLGTSESAPMQQRTLQAYLKGANPSYRTGIFGKYLNGWGFNCPNATGPPRPPFFDDYAIFQESSYSPTCVTEDEAPGTEKYVWQYSTNYVRDKALEFLGQASGSGQPWFLYVAPYTPHSPFLPEAKYQGANVPDLPQTASVFEPDRTDKPAWVREREIVDAAETREDWKQHLRMLKSADDMVDAIMRKLKDLGQDGNTIAFFVSDNGLMWGDHGGTSKARPYLASVKVPFYMRWPGWPGHTGNETDNRLTALVDIAPTALDAAAITPGDAKDGRSLLQTTNSRKHLFMEQKGADIAVPSWLSILTTKLHYIETYKTTQPGGVTDYSQVESREYYDLTQDPLELTNLLGDDDPLNDPPIAGLSAKLAADKACAGSTCPPGGGDPPLEVKITRGPADDDRNSGSAYPEFHFTSSEPDATFECMLGGPFLSPSWAQCLNPKQYVGLTNGDYTFSVRAKQPGPVYSDPATYAWHIDASVPETAIGLHPAKRSTNPTAWFGFSSSYSPPLFKCRFNGGIWETCPSVYSFPVADTPASAPHKLEVKAISPYSSTVEDPTPASYEWSVDSTPMEIDPATFAPTTSPNERQAKFVFSAKAKPESAELPGEEKPTRYECNLDDRPGWDPCASPKTYTGVASGHRTFQVRVTDLAGNVSAPRVYEWDVGSVQTYHTLPDTSWPDVTAGTEVRTVIPDSCGGWFVGGTFSEVLGVPVANLAHINSNKSVDTTWQPSVTRTSGTPSVRALLLGSGTLYIGGQFTHVDGTTRSNLAAVTVPGCAPPAAAAVTTWNPSPNNFVYALTFSRVTPGALYAAGAFGTFTQGSTTTTQRKVAEIRTTDTGSLTSWHPDVNGSATLLAVATGTTGVYIGGNGLTSVGGATRTNLAEIDPVTAQATPWTPNPDGGVNSIYWRRIAVADSVGAAAQLPTVLVGGGFTHIGKPLPGSGQPARSKAAELDASDEGFATPWDPSLSTGSPTGGAAYDILPITTSSTIVGGSFSKVGTVDRGRLAEVDRATGTVLDWNPNPDAAAFDFAYKTSGNKFIAPPVMAVGGLFGNVGTPAQQRRTLAFYCRMDLSPSC